MDIMIWCNAFLSCNIYILVICICHLRLFHHLLQFAKSIYFLYIHTSSFWKIRQMFDESLMSVYLFAAMVSCSSWRNIYRGLQGSLKDSACVWLRISITSWYICTVLFRMVERMKEEVCWTDAKVLSQCLSKPIWFFMQNYYIAVSLSPSLAQRRAQNVY